MTRLMPRIMMIAGLAVVYSAHLGSNAAQQPEQSESGPQNPKSPASSGEQDQKALADTVQSAVNGNFLEREGGLVLSTEIRVDGSDSGEAVQYQIGTTKERTRVFVPVRGDLSSFEQAINGLALTKFGPLGEELVKCDNSKERVCVVTCGSGTNERCCKWECQ